mmetsp:Transcript_72215/g.182046  ORF Transcript_72215/g.182046 Transcript_72215/m.182046 type:complete len:269 (+) Transcript_72215:317-1123(+)
MRHSKCAGSDFAERPQLRQPLLDTMSWRSWVDLRIWPSKSWMVGTSLNLRVFTVQGALRSPIVLLAASISYQESPITTRLMLPRLSLSGDAPAAAPSPSSSRKASRFQAKGSSGKACSCLALAEIVVIFLSTGTSPGKKRAALSGTQDSVPFVTMSVSPRDIAVRRNDSAALSSCPMSSGVGICPIRSVELHSKVSSQSKIMTVRHPYGEASLSMLSLPGDVAAEVLLSERPDMLKRGSNVPSSWLQPISYTEPTDPAADILEASSPM